MIVDILLHIIIMINDVLLHFLIIIDDVLLHNTNNNKYICMAQ